MITLYWVYNLPNWLFALLCIVAFTSFGLIGLPLTRGFARRVHREDHSHNDIVGYYLAAVTVFYGITLGLVAVGTWTNFSTVQDHVDHEAQTVAAFYRDARCLPEPYRTAVMTDLRSYVREVLDHSWAQQQQGLVPAGTDPIMDHMEMTLAGMQPSTPGTVMLAQEAFKQYNNLVEARRARLDSTFTGLPRSLWWMVILGALTSITVTFFFDMRSIAMHRWMTGLMGGLLGLMIFLIATLDNPYRGKVSVGPQAFERVYTSLMK